jgi:hypothetical protein
MSVHIQEIEDAVKQSPHSNWQPLYEKVKLQMILRSLSCIQLSNKLICSNGTVKTG